MIMTMAIGNLTEDPEATKTENGIFLCRFTLAVDTDARGAAKRTEFVKVTVWDKRAESCMKYLKKGRLISVYGEPSVSPYIGRDGKARASMRLNAYNVSFLSVPKGEEVIDEPIDQSSGINDSDIAVPGNDEIPF